MISRAWPSSTKPVTHWLTNCRSTATRRRSEPDAVRPVPNTTRGLQVHLDLCIKYFYVIWNGRQVVHSYGYRHQPNNVLFHILWQVVSMVTEFWAVRIFIVTWWKIRMSSPTVVILVPSEPWFQLHPYWTFLCVPTPQRNRRHTDRLDVWTRLRLMDWAAETLWRRAAAMRVTTAGCLRIAATLVEDIWMFEVQVKISSFFSELYLIPWQFWWFVICKPLWDLRQNKYSGNFILNLNSISDMLFALLSFQIVPMVTASQSFVLSRWT